MLQSENLFQAVGWGNCKAHLLYFLSLKVRRLVLLLVQDLTTIISYILHHFLFVYGEKATPVAVDPS